MDILGYLLVALVSICVLVFIAVVYKRNVDKDTDTEMYKESASSAPATPSTPAAQQTTLYEYIFGDIKICANCDGENRANVRFCKICGAAMDGKE